MKKNTAQTPATLNQTKKLFGMSVDQLKTVHGGGGVIVQEPTK